MDVKTENSFVKKIEGYIDSYLKNQSRDRQVELSRLYVYMVILNGKLYNVLYLDNKTALTEVTISDIVGSLTGMLLGTTIINSIENGFKKYAEANSLDVEKLQLGLFYKNGELIYQAYYNSDPIQVDLETFFAKQ